MFFGQTVNRTFLVLCYTLKPVELRHSYEEPERGKVTKQEKAIKEENAKA